MSQARLGGLKQYEIFSSQLQKISYLTKFCETHSCSLTVLNNNYGNYFLASNQLKFGHIFVSDRIFVHHY